MIIFLIAIIFVLLIVIFLQFKSRKNRSNNLKYIHEKLNSILANGTAEKLLLLTDDKALVALLIEINRLLEDNQKMYANYNRNEIAMRKMLSNISHDLKTPLTVVLGYIEMLRLNEDLSGTEREAILIKLENKGKEVLELINRFFDLAKLESGDKDIPLSRINMSELCKKTILDFYDTINADGREIAIDIPSYSLYALGNEDALNRVMNNLISNAIKYGKDGKKIGVNLKCDDSYVFVEVWDNGKGISEANMERVFERMYTLEDSRNKSYQGSGLGLTITKRLVEKLGGEIFLESKPYDKTIFSFKLKRLTY
jgi:signal transduction histidine kinase